MIHHRTIYPTGYPAGYLAGVLAFVLFLSGMPAFGQATAVVQGTVLDETGAAISGAQVTLTSSRHAEDIMTAETREDGAFVFFQVPFEAYLLTVQMEGFRTHQQQADIHTTAVSLPITMNVGAVTERVEVTALGLGPEADGTIPRKQVIVAAILFMPRRPAWTQATALIVPNLNWRLGAC